MRQDLSQKYGYTHFGAGGMEGIMYTTKFGKGKQDSNASKETKQGPMAICGICKSEDSNGDVVQRVVCM